MSIDKDMYVFFLSIYLEVELLGYWVCIGLALVVNASFSET